MKLPIYSGFAVTIGMALLLVNVGCSNTGRNTAADRPAGQEAADRNSATVSAADRDFATKAAQIGLAEVELGNLAQQKGSSQEVKDFGRKLVEDHSKVNADLKDIAAKEGITIPGETDRKHRDLIDKLSKLSGKEFDREFAKHMVDGHRDAIDLFRKEAESTMNQSLKTFASNTLPTLQDHLNMAESINRNLSK